MAHGDPLLSPWVWWATDNEGDQIRITVTFNDATRALTGATVFRDANCTYRKIYIGLGADGTPDTTTSSFAVAAGSTAITANQLRQRGLDTIEDILALQITAGP